MHIQKDRELWRAACPFGLWHGPAVLFDVVVDRCAVLCFAAAAQEVAAVLAELSALEAARDFACFHGPDYRPTE
jgi:hypothetical protein